MKKLTPELHAGCWVDGARGQYMAGRILEICMDYGFNPNTSDFNVGDWNLDGGPFDDGDKPSVSDYEWVHDLVDEATDYMQQFAPAGYWFGYYPDWGDWGLYQDESDEDEE